MRRIANATAAAAILLLIGVADGSAQSRPRFLIGVSGGVQPDSGAVSQSIVFKMNDEQTPIRTDVSGAAIPLVDVGGVARLFGNVGAGIALSWLSRSVDAEVEASIPHPFFYNQSRDIEGVAPGLNRTETAVHVVGTYTAAIGNAWLTLFAGPTFFRAKQDFVTDVRYTEEYPFDTASFTGAELRLSEASRTGYNVGADVVWALTREFGIGALARFSRARATFSSSAGNVDYGTLDLGGVQVAGGVRVGF